jgi:hypothetical protein
MARATLTFNLPEESAEHSDAVKGADWKQVVFEIDRKLKDTVDYSDSSDRQGLAAELRNAILDEMRERGLTF